MIMQTPPNHLLHLKSGFGLCLRSMEHKVQMRRKDLSTLHWHTIIDHNASVVSFEEIEKNLSLVFF